LDKNVRKECKQCAEKTRDLMVTNEQKILKACDVNYVYLCVSSFLKLV